MSAELLSAAMRTESVNMLAKRNRWGETFSTYGEIGGRLVHRRQRRNDGSYLKRKLAFAALQKASKPTALEEI